MVTLLRQQLEEEDQNVGLSLDEMEGGENEQQDENEEDEEEDRPRQKYDAAKWSGRNGTMQLYAILWYWVLNISLNRLSKKQKRKKKQQKVVHVSTFICYI